MSNQASKEPLVSQIEFEVIFYVYQSLPGLSKMVQIPFITAGNKVEENPHKK